MARVLDQPRYACALGAMNTVHSIEGAIPVLHAGPGCAGKLAGYNGSSGRFSPNLFPCTSVSEKEVVFGGEEKLRSTIDNALKVIDAQLFVTLSGCSAELIGDDIAEVVGKFQADGKPVVYVNTPGFKGNNYEGHGWALQAIFDQFLPPKAGAPDKKKGLVNLFTGMPKVDPYWHGNLRELERLLGLLGLEVNTIFGYGRGVEAVKRLPEAEMNIVVSPWAGVDAVKFLSEKYGAPLLHCPVLPIGAFETTKFLAAAGEFAGIPADKVRAITDEQEREYYYFIERFADFFLETRIVSKRFVTIGDAQYALAFTKFLVNDIGMFPTSQYIMDRTPEEWQPSIREEFKRLSYGIESDVMFTTDGYEVHRHIRETDFGGYPLVLGGSWDKQISNEIHGNYVNLFSPMIEKLVINSHLAGYSGGLKLLEEIWTAGLTRLIL
jgi:nitrogenase molybdenum-iron protein beta chain